MINWEVVLWTCITLAVIMGVIAMILTVISAVNMKKRRKQIGDLHTTLAVGSKVMFAGGIYGKVVRLGQEEIIDVEVAPKTIIQISRFAIQGIVEYFVSQERRIRFGCVFFLCVSETAGLDRVIL